ncbi:hypothetical protein [Streptomyces sp. NPDC093568]|uniref:hypothetical protein n=1 Tax=Streptomyces sp. NPDC093568 TaxID=3366041 RepID=UPI003815BCBB
MPDRPVARPRLARSLADLSTHLQDAGRLPAAVSAAEAVAPFVHAMAMARNAGVMDLAAGCRSASTSPNAGPGRRRGRVAASGRP